MDSLQARVAKMNEYDLERKRAATLAHDGASHYYAEHYKDKAIQANELFRSEMPTAIQALNEAMALLREAGEALAWEFMRSNYVGDDRRTFDALTKLRNAGVIV